MLQKLFPQLLVMDDGIRNAVISFESDFKFNIVRRRWGSFRFWPIDVAPTLIDDPMQQK